MTDSFPPMERKTLHKERYFSSTHHYFFEVKEASNGTKYIVIDQKRKVGDAYVGAKLRIFEDELLEFQRVLQKMVRLALDEESYLNAPSAVPPALSLREKPEFDPPFFEKLVSSGDWREFEQYTHYLLKLLGIQTVYTFVHDTQAGRPDGFLKLGNLAVIYDCTLDGSRFEDSKRDQIINYCNRLKQGSVELDGGRIEEFQQHHKQVWLITRGSSRRIRLVNDIVVKEVAIRDLIGIYKERLHNLTTDDDLETRLRNL